VTQAPAEPRKPLLVVGHGIRSAPALQIVEAASGLCDILWLIDVSVPANATTSRLLRKVGTVVDVAGLAPEQIASVLRPYRPDGLVAYRDEDVIALSAIASELSLEYHSPELARRLLDKVCQREALRDAGLPTPKCWEIPAERDAQSVRALAEQVEFPAILKPRTGHGSEYILPVVDPDDLVRKVAALPAHAGGDPGMFVEQFLADMPPSPEARYADYVSVESLLSSGEISHVAVTGRFPLAEPFRETGFVLPADLPADQREAVLEVATKALQALGATAGGFHTEIKMTPDGPRVIEVNGRLGGGVPEMLSQASGESIMAMSMRIALGEKVVLHGLLSCPRIGWRFFFQPPTTARKVVSITGLDRLADKAGVKLVYVHHGPGDPVDWREGTGQFIFEASGVAESYEEVFEIDRFLHEDVLVTYE
jgi:biotin carboxylase